MTTKRKPFELMDESERQTVGRALWERHRPRCQSALVDELVRESREGFETDDIVNLYPDPSDWGLDRCRSWLRDQGVDLPDGDPYGMDLDELRAALLEVGIEPGDDDAPTLLAAVVANIDDGTIEGIELWRDAVRDNADAAEVMEWWEVGDWLAERLEREGEVVIRNGYGDWWGRCCTGQATYLDSVIQRLGAEYCGWALDKD